MPTMIDESVPGFDEVYKALEDKVHGFNVLRTLSAKSDSVGQYCNLEVALASVHDERVIVVICDHVSTYKVDFANIGAMFVSGLQIVDARKNGLERVKWVVSDYEGGKLTVHCRNLAIELRIERNR